MIILYKILIIKFEKNSFDKIEQIQRLKKFAFFLNL